MSGNYVHVCEYSPTYEHSPVCECSPYSSNMYTHSTSQQPNEVFKSTQEIQGMQEPLLPKDSILLHVKVSQLHLRILATSNRHDTRNSGLSGRLVLREAKGSSFFNNNNALRSYWTM